jgi:hypothetical protein
MHAGGGMLRELERQGANCAGAGPAPDRCHLARHRAPRALARDVRRLLSENESHKPRPRPPAAQARGAIRWLPTWRSGSTHPTDEPRAGHVVPGVIDRTIAGEPARQSNPLK